MRLSFYFLRIRILCGISEKTYILANGICETPGTGTERNLPQSSFLVAFSVLIIGIIIGLDGSGFSGLPLTGSPAASLETSGIDASTLAAIGQMGSIWTGGGTVVAWSSLIAIAGFCGVTVMELVRKNFFPVIIGLIIATFAAVFLF